MHAVIEPFLVAAGGVWGIWYLTRPSRHALKGTLRDRLISAGGALSKDHKPMVRKFKPYLGKWNSDVPL